MDAQKKKMIFLFSVISVLVVAIVIIVIGQLTGSFQIIKTEITTSSSSVVTSSTPSSSKNDTPTTEIGGAESAIYSSDTNIQAKSDDFYIDLAKAHPVKITKEAYERTLIKENQEGGLSYNDVVAIIGGDGVKVDSNQENCEIYMWTTADNTGYAKLIFEDGKLTGRSQWGLK